MTLWLKTADGIVPVGGAYQTVTPWTPVTYTNSWVSYGSPYGGVEYRRLGDVVQLRGSMKNGNNQQSAFTLPVGFRPTTYPLTVNVTNWNSSAPVAGHAQIGTNGNCVMFLSSTVEVGFATQFSLTPTGQAPDYTKAPNGLWTQYTPTVYQSVSVTCSAPNTRYIKIGRTVIMNVSLGITSTGTAGHAIRFSVPHTMSATTAILGAGRFTDASGPYYIYPATIDYYDANSVVLSNATSSGAGTWWLGTVAFTGAVTTNDGISGTIVYEATA